MRKMILITTNPFFTTIKSITISITKNIIIMIEMKNHKVNSTKISEIPQGVDPIGETKAIKDISEEIITILILHQIIHIIMTY